MTLDEMKKKIKSRNKMFADAREGKDPQCPKCKKGHIKCRGNYFFYCNNSECDVKISLDPIRPDQK